jgi:hypothetical protein
VAPDGRDAVGRGEPRLVGARGGRRRRRSC